MENDRKLCEKIRALRRKSGLSQEELAEKIFALISRKRLTKA